VTRGLLLIGSCVCAALTVATYVVAFGTGKGRSFDASMFGAAVGAELPGVRDAAGDVVGTTDVASVLFL